MFELQKAIVLRASSAYRSKIILLSEEVGKIEGYVAHRKFDLKLSHGAFISCAISKKGMRYQFSDVKILDMPLYWARENFLFFHHVLELCNLFLSWDERVEEIFQLMQILYTSPQTLCTPHAQKKFLCAFFGQLGMYPEQGDHSLESWLRSCISEHPQSNLLKTADFLKILESYEEAV